MILVAAAFKNLKVEDIDADTLAIRIAGWKTLVLDLRHESAFRAGRIPEAILIPRNELATALQGLPFETSLSLICDTWEQSRSVAGLLWDMGYRNIAVLRGGFATYIERGLPVSTL
jgi:rhodanese-related sulfurtransferase